MLILVINCGSSSAKYKLFDMSKKKQLAKGLIKKIALIKEKLKTYRIGAIGHRVVHGGEEFKKSVVITGRVVKSIERSSALAPLHNPPSLEGIRSCRRHFRGIPQVAVFDTAFHMTLAPHAYLYGIPLRFYDKYKIRRYGFHGTSHRFVAEEAAKRLKRPVNRLKLVTVHLGNGCSMAAVSAGRSIDTTMGFTPLEGLLMGTRSGDLDPAIVTFLMEKENLSIEGINEILNKKSGLLGVSGVSNDMRNIISAAKKENKRAKLALDMFAYRIKKYIGAYAACMNGLDAVVFTGGIGENVPEIKETLAGQLKPVFGRRVRFLTVPTNEELLIARDTYNLVRKETK